MYVAREYDELWERFRAGDPKALGYIYDQYILLLYRYGHKITSNRSIVEDSIQDVFTELWKRRKSISATTSIKFYLFRALRQKILRQLKYQDSPIQLDPTIRVTHTIDASLTDEQVSTLQQALSDLSPRQKEVIYLKFYNRLPNDEIAAVMDIDKRTVYNLVSQALSRLRQQPELKLAFKMLQVLGWFMLYFLYM